MLVELSISTWTARKKDKQASEDVTRSNGADSGAASVNKNLLSGCDELTAIASSEPMRVTSTTR